VAALDQVCHRGQAAAPVVRRHAGQVGPGDRLPATVHDRVAGRDQTGEALAIAGRSQEDRAVDRGGPHEPVDGLAGEPVGGREFHQRLVAARERRLDDGDELAVGAAVEAAVHLRPEL